MSELRLALAGVIVAIILLGLFIMWKDGWKL
jgi:hypothetical protein